MDNHIIHPKLKALTDLMSGTWRVSGKGIRGEAEYTFIKEGLVLVMHVDFEVDGNKLKNTQHIAYDPDTDTLRSHYMDTMGNDDTYTWVLEGKKIGSVSGARIRTPISVLCQYGSGNSVRASVIRLR